LASSTASHRPVTSYPPLLLLPRPWPVARETAEHPFGTLKMRMGATHFMMKRLPKVATDDRGQLDTETRN